MISLKELEYAENLKSYFKEIGEDECWIWQGSIDNKGYGRYWTDGKHVIAHRAVYELYKGEIPKGMGLLHSCDKTLCVNPKHLKPGTQKDNIQDAVAKGRIATGQRHGMATLTDQEGREVRDLANCGLFSQRQIAFWYGIARATVSQIKTGARRSVTTY